MTDVAEIAKGLSEAQRQVLAAMSGGDWAPLLANVSADAGVPFKEARAIVRQFRSDGLAEFGVLYDEFEPFMRGSGYWLSKRGLAVRSYLATLADAEG